MAVLPVSTLNLNAGTIVESEPSLTWFIDQKSKRIRGTCDGYDAVKQAVDIILHRALPLADLPSVKRGRV